MLQVDVIYENGVFRPLQPTELPEGALGRVFVAPAPDMQGEQDLATEVVGAESPAQQAYRLLMEIAALPHASPDQHTDVGPRHDDFLYPKHGSRP